MHIGSDSLFQNTHTEGKLRNKPGKTNTEDGKAQQLKPKALLSRFKQIMRSKESLWKNTAGIRTG